HPVTTNIEKIEKLINRKRQTDTQKVTSKLITIACSTGGPKALHSVIPNIPKNIDAGVIVIQHMPEGFTKSLADRLNSLSEIFVKEADDGDILMKGRVYIAKGGKHLRVVKDKQGNHIIRISDEEPRRGLKPSADIMYESLLDSDYDEITCVVLTGMGSDGRDGILNLSNKKRVYVIAQDRKSSVVYGMPKMIKMTGLVDKEVSLHEVSEAIIKYVGVD
ncbi:MAG: chemotaxis protein CheB, partial [Clostridiales bacterium]|nr:chemotaxis protein CheB [Clostridiales bacterium]